MDSFLKIQTEIQSPTADYEKCKTCVVLKTTYFNFNKLSINLQLKKPVSSIDMSL